MKIILSAIFFFLSSIGLVFSETESDITLGYEYSKMFESQSPNGTKIDSEMDSTGINLSAYSFWNRGDIGLYVHDSFLFPSKGKITVGGNSASFDFSTYDFLMSTGIIIGPGFRSKINDSTSWYFGIGPRVMVLSGSYKKISSGYYYTYSQVSYNLGVGGDVSIKFDINDSFTIRIGSALTYDFRDYSSLTSSFASASGWATNYSAFSIMPFATIGFNFYQADSALGKPKS